MKYAIAIASVTLFAVPAILRAHDLLAHVAAVLAH